MRSARTLGSQLVRGGRHLVWLEVLKPELDPLLLGQPRQPVIIQPVRCAAVLMPVTMERGLRLLGFRCFFWLTHGSIFAPARQRTNAAPTSLRPAGNEATPFGPPRPVQQHQMTSDAVSPVPATASMTRRCRRDSIN